MRRLFLSICNQSQICATNYCEQEPQSELTMLKLQVLSVKADFKSKSYIALKEARESLYWLDLLHRNNYLTDVQFNSLKADHEELVKVLTHRCKKLDNVGGSEK